MSFVRKKYKQSRPIKSDSTLSLLSEKLHLMAHLAMTELRLRLKIKKSTKKRKQLLNALHQYWKRGLFPKNSYNKNERTPVFIDESNVYCAVGYLMKKTGYDDLAQDINRRNKFLRLEDEIDDVRIEKWLKEHSISQQEAALIQPGYGGIEPYSTLHRAFHWTDIIFYLATIISTIALIWFISILLLGLTKDIKKRSLENTKRGASKALGGITLVIILFLVAVPSPIVVLDSLQVFNSDYNSSNWVICESPRGHHYDRAMCQDYRRKGFLPGWEVK